MYLVKIIKAINVSYFTGMIFTVYIVTLLISHPRGDINVHLLPHCQIDRLVGENQLLEDEKEKLVQELEKVKFSFLPFTIYRTFGLYWCLNYTSVSVQKIKPKALSLFLRAGLAITFVRMKTN